MNELEGVINAWKIKLGTRLVCVVLFGSQARGDDRLDSDCDLFIVLNKPPQNPWERAQHIRSLTPPGHPPLNLLVYSPQEIDQDIFPLLLDVACDGVVLYDAQGFFEPRRKKILSILHEAGLERKRHQNEFTWQWRMPPGHRWELTWSGYRELS